MILNIIALALVCIASVEPVTTVPGSCARPAGLDRESGSASEQP
jgi:hypothetical protein